MVHLPEAVQQEVQGAGPVGQPSQQGSARTARRAQHLQRAAGQLALTTEKEVNGENIERLCIKDCKYVLWDGGAALFLTRVKDNSWNTG